VSLRQISGAIGIGKTVIGEYVRRAGVLGITWPEPEGIPVNPAGVAVDG
jgi:hypothetical protein